MITGSRESLKTGQANITRTEEYNFHATASSIMSQMPESIHFISCLLPDPQGSDPVDNILQHLDGGLLCIDICQ
jgi:hypothetical protein